MSEPAAIADVTEDLFLGGQLRLLQPKRGHRAGHDALLLAAATPARAGQSVVEFGSGVGAAGLAVARRVADTDLTLVDIDSALASLAQTNALANRIDARVIALDVTASADVFREAGLGPDSADVVLMNPPFHDGARHRASPDMARQIAHMASDDTLESWVHAARRLLKSGGTLTLIWRADGLPDVLAALARGFGGVNVVPVHPRPGEEAIRVLVRAVKGRRAPLVLHPAIVLQDENGSGSAEARALLEGRAVLPLAKMPDDR